MKKDRQRAPMGVQLPQLRGWRLYKLMSMRALSEASGVSPNTINNVETQQGYARFETVGKLAKGLGITPEQLVYQEPPAMPGQHQQTEGDKNEGRAVA